MAKGENIFKRKDGRWEARYIKGYELSGKIKYGFCYGKTYREAKEKVTKCKAALVNGKSIPSTNSRHRFSFYCDEWLRMRKPKVKESTYIKYDTALRKHIKPKLGGCFPMGMTTGLIDDFTEELLFEDELAPKTVHDVLVVLHGILKYTATFFTGGFPAIEINYPKPGKKEMRVLSREEQTRFVSYLLDDMDTCKFALMCVVIFPGIPSFAVSGVDISGLGIVDDVRFQHGDLRHAALCRLYFRRQFLRPGACGIRIIDQSIEICEVMLLDEQQCFSHAFQLYDFQLLVVCSAFAAADFGFNLRNQRRP